MIIDHKRFREKLGGQLVPGDMSRDFIGVNLSRSGLASQILPTFFQTKINWAAGAYDIGGWFSAGSPTIVTVPVGVTRVRSFYSVLFTGAFIGGELIFLTQRLNGITNVAEGQTVFPVAAAFFNLWVATTGPYDVTPGDTISVQMFPILPTLPSLSVFGSADTAFGVEAVTMEF